MKLHLEVLGRSQKAVLRRLAPVAGAQGFYLAGGTGLALHLGHRHSVDFDWFRERPIRDPLQLAREIGVSGPSLRVDRTERGTLHGTVTGVRLSFLEYRYPLLSPLRRERELGLALASTEDIAAMKLAAVVQRGSKKDFVDVFALGESLELEDMLRLYRRKYRVKDVGHVLVALSYFDDADRERMPTMRRPWKWPDIKTAIRRWVKGVASS